MTPADELSQGLDQLRDSITRTAQVAPQVARQEIRREGRAYFRGAVVASVITSLLVGVPLGLLANQFSQHANADGARAAQFQSQAQSIQQLAQSAHDLGVQANAELTRRSLATVPIPAPGTVPDSQVLASAVQAYTAANAQGLRGPQGATGVPGASPPCLAQPTQCQGLQGGQGPRGEPPVGWTVEESDGSAATCERIAAFNPAAPQYRCSHATPPPRSGGGPSTTPRR
ncbi:MAG: hypothetical protein JO364_19440 [Pseudonocardiales bacterium]|nr:hypothetical protein [Pseudonocardiales bacterium]MBV9032431.1 hypothetical protein [Pseudonocardiales bacterium]